MKIVKKSKVDTAPVVKKALDADTSAVLTEEEILTLKDALPKLVALLNGEAEIEILDGTEDAGEIEDIEADNVITPIDDVVEEDVEDVEEKAEDNAGTFNADEVLNDPAKRAAIEEALKKKAGDGEKPKAQDQAPAIKKIFKKVVNQKAGDAAIEPEKKNPNAELVNVPAKKAADKAIEPTVKSFDFHRNNK